MECTNGVTRIIFGVAEFNPIYAYRGGGSPIAASTKVLEFNPIYAHRGGGFWDWG
jgi:hypothetical protein